MHRERATWRWLAWIVLAIGLAVRVGPWLRMPQLAWEDGALLFARSYDELHASDWIAPYAGYVPFGSNLMASLLCRLPTAWIPTAFVVGAAAVSFAAGAWLLRQRWRVVASLPMRCLCAAIVAWLPLATNLERTSLAYAQWPALFWLALIMFEPGRRARSWPILALVLVLAASHPLSAFLVPFGLVRRHHRDARWRVLGLTVVAQWLIRLLVGGGTGAPEHLAGSGLGEATLLLVVRVVLESLFGQPLRLELEQSGLLTPVVFGVVGVVVFAGACACRRAAPATRAFVTQLLPFAGATVLAAALLRSSCRYEELDCVRYLWLARVAFLCSLVLMLASLLPTRPLVIGFALLSCWLVYSHRAVYRHPGPDRALRSFLSELERQEQVRGGRTWIRARCERPGQPPIVIRPH